MNKTKRIVLVLLIIVFSVGCDQFTKVIAKTYLPRARALSFAGDTFRLDYTLNKGGAFSFEYSLPETWRGTASTFVVSLMVAFLVLYLVLAHSLRPLMSVALSLFCGGVLSNLHDRIAFSGHVVDFLTIHWGGLRHCVFNVADVAIVIGLVLFIWSVIRNLRTPKSFGQP